MPLDDLLKETVRNHRIRVFWEWFADNHEPVAAAYSANRLAWLDENLTPRIQSVHARLHWEMGPYRHPDNTLVISPCIRENLQMAERVVAAAPAVAGWHFLPAKPPKDLKRLVMELPGIDGAAVCGDRWEYRLTSYNQMEFFDIEVVTDVDASIADRDLRQLTHLLLEALLGERLYLERIATVKMQRPTDPRPAGKLTRLRLLPRHLASLLGSAASVESKRTLDGDSP